MSEPTNASPAPAAPEPSSPLHGIDATQLFVALHEELRRMAGRIAAGQVGHTLQPTALVNETYLRLFSGRPRSWNDEVHFMRSAAVTMRRILLDHVKRPHRRQAQLSAMDNALDGMLVDLEERCGGDLEAIDEAIEQLTVHDEQIATYVILRFFGGRTNLETTRILGIGERTGEHHWVFARSWLAARLRP